jgi:hypothetical protein
MEVGEIAETNERAGVAGDEQGEREAILGPT